MVWLCVQMLMIILMSGCGEKTVLNTPTKKVEAFFANYQTLDDNVLAQLDETIDKDDTLTDEQKVIVEEIKAQRAEHKAKKAEMKSVRVLFEKVKNGETLSSDEQTKLDEFKANMPQRHMK